MKTKHRSLALLLLLAVLPLFASGQDNVRTPSAAAAPEGMGELQNATFERRAEFVSAARDLVIKLDARIAQLNRPGSGPADAARAKAVDEAKSARILLENQLGKVDAATAANWNVVRDSVLDALARVQAASQRAAEE